MKHSNNKKYGNYKIINNTFHYGYTKRENFINDCMVKPYQKYVSDKQENHNIQKNQLDNYVL